MTKVELQGQQSARSRGYHSDYVLARIGQSTHIRAPNNDSEALDLDVISSDLLTSKAMVSYRVVG